MSIFAYHPFEKSYAQTNVKMAAEYTDKLRGEEVEIHAVFPKNHPYSLNPLVSIFDLHSDKEIVFESYYDPRTITRKKPFLDWTWEYRTPPYYGDKPLSSIVAVISPTANQRLPGGLAERLKGYRLKKLFDAGKASTLQPFVVRIYIEDPVLVVTSPKMGEEWKGNQTIAWKLDYPGREGEFITYVYSPSTGKHRALGETHRKSLNWSINSSEYPPAKDYKVRVYFSDDGWQSWTWNESSKFAIIQ